MDALCRALGQLGLTELVSSQHPVLATMVKHPMWFHILSSAYLSLLARLIL